MSKIYLQNIIKKRLERKAHERYQNLTKEEKEKKTKKWLSEAVKRKVVEYRKKYYRTRKNVFL